MPIRQWVGDASFDPDEIDLLNEAFNDCLVSLGLTDRTDPLAEIVARKIIEVARQGERDPKRLCELATKDLKR